MHQHLFSLVLAIFLGLTAPAQAVEYDVPSSHKEMLHVNVTASNVQLRSGAGTEFESLGMANRGRRYVADAQTRKDSMGKTWFRLIAHVEQQTELGVYSLDAPCWIRNDFVKARPLRDREIDRVNSLFFRILAISPEGLPRFRLTENLSVYSEESCMDVEARPVADKILPAGDTFILLGVDYDGKNSCVNLWKDTGQNSVQLAGTLRLEEFLKLDFGSSRPAVEHWLKRYNLQFP